MKALQSVHAANWVDVFLGLWTAALRLVYRVCMFEALCECKVEICSSFCVLFKYMTIGCKLHLCYSPAGIDSVGNTTRPI
jgi:hypothetical protein